MSCATILIESGLNSHACGYQGATVVSDVVCRLSVIPPDALMRDVWLQKPRDFYLMCHISHHIQLGKETNRLSKCCVRIAPLFKRSFSLKHREIFIVF